MSDLHRRLRTALLLGATGLVSGGCSELPTTEPDGPVVPLSLDIVSGNSQVGPPGQELPQPLVVRVTGAGGATVPGQIVNFRVTSGGGSVYAGAGITNASGIAQERWTLGTAASDSQRVEARAVNSSTGAKQLFGTFRATVQTAPPPVVQTEPTSMITSDWARMWGEVSPRGSPTTAWFEWGTDAALATFQSAGTTGPFMGDNSRLRHDQTGLGPSTTYYYRLVAENAGGRTRGQIRSFRTSPAGGTIVASQSGLSAAAAAVRIFQANLPAGVSRLEAVTSGGTGDPDLYVRRSEQPRRDGTDACGSNFRTNREACSVDNPQAGTWHIMVYAYGAFSGVSLTVRTYVGGSTAPAIALSPSSVSFSASAGGPDPPTQHVSVTNAGGGTLDGLGGTFRYATGQPTGWLTPVLERTFAPTRLVVSAETGSLAPGTYQASLDITSPAASNSPRMLPVSFIVTGGTADRIVDGVWITATWDTYNSFDGSGLGPPRTKIVREAPMPAGTYCPGNQLDLLRSTIGSGAFNLWHGPGGCSNIPTPRYFCVAKGMVNGGNPNLKECATDPLKTSPSQLWLDPPFVFPVWGSLLTVNIFYCRSNRTMHFFPAAPRMECR